MDTNPDPFVWKIRQEHDERWHVVNWVGQDFYFETESAARDFIERDKNMFAEHTEDVRSQLEQAEESPSEGEEVPEEQPLALNRQARRRVERLAGRQPSSRRTRKRPKRGS